MKKITLFATALIVSLTVQATKLEATGTLKWTGFGVGKSHSGDMAIKSGHIELKGKNIISGEFTLDMTSLSTTDSPKLQGHLRSPDFFDVEKYKEATFKITAIKALKSKAKAGESTHEITGDLTIKNKTHTETFFATIIQNGNFFEAKADAEIKDRTQYDIVYNSAKFKTIASLGDKLIQDNIKIQLNLKTK